MIGILTFSTNTNYGSWLLSYALYKVVIELGYDAELIRYFYPECDLNERFTLPFIKAVLTSNSDLKQKVLFMKNRFLRQIKFEACYRKYVKGYYSVRRENIDLLDRRYDRYLVGSDTVWDHRDSGDTYTYFLDFAEKSKKRMSFAASMGYKEIPIEKENTIRECLQKFDYISVREYNTCKLLQKIGISSSLVCDPTMLITPDKWKKIMSKRLIPEEYIILYIADDYFLCKRAEKYAKSRGLKIVVLSDSEQIVKGACLINDIGPLDWISLIYYADKVFTGSYHAILFSIYFNKKLCYVRRNPVNRMYNLEERLGIGCMEIRAEAKRNTQENWKDINMKMQEFREDSMNQLIEMLEKTTV